MNKLVALICVVSWSGFWAFGYLALSADIQHQSQVMIAALLAVFGFLTGVFAYIKLSRDRPTDYRRVQQG
jgi:membrane associated rhomboid family serine protease